MQHDLASQLHREEADCRMRKAGFEVLRAKGSHHILRHADGRTTVVPAHSGDTIGPGLLAKILRDCDLSREQLSNLL